MIPAPIERLTRAHQTLACGEIAAATRRCSKKLVHRKTEAMGKLKGRTA